MAAKINEGLRLKIMRLKAGLLQYQLAAQLGIHASRLSEIESGRRTPPPDLEEKLRWVLGLPRKREKGDGQAQA